MEKVSRQEWPGIVEKLKRAASPVPEALIANYDNWECHSFAGRAFYALGDVENAIMILAPLLTVEPDMQDVPEEGFSQAEHKILCLRDMAEIIWQLTQNGGAALNYLDAALELCKKYSGKLVTADRGKIWVRRLELKVAMGQEREALLECSQKLAELAVVEGPNPYLYWACLFMARMAEQAGELDKAMEWRQQAEKHVSQDTEPVLTIAEVRRKREELLKKKYGI